MRSEQDVGVNVFADMSFNGDTPIAGVEITNFYLNPSSSHVQS